MLLRNVAIIGVAHVDAPHRMSSAEIEQQLESVADKFGMPAGLLENLSGIAARRFWDKGVQPSDAATLAAKKVIEESGIPPEKLGILINSSVCRDYVEPSTACLVHGNLGLPPSCINFDLSNACLGFVNAMDYIGQLIDNGHIEYGIVVDGEGSRYTIEKTIEKMLDPECDVKTFRNNYATLTLGSGGAAMILGRRDKHPEAPVFRGMVTLAATQHNRLCIGQMDGMVTNTKELLIRGLELAAQTWELASKTFDWTAEDISQFILHQVSRVHTENLAGILNFDMARAHTIYQEFGNIGPAGLPITLSKALEAGRIAKGDRVALLGIGSGLNCAMGEVAW